MNNPFVMTKENTTSCGGISLSINSEVFLLFDCCSFLGLGLSTISLFSEEKDGDFLSCKHPAGDNNFDDDYDDYDDTTLNDTMMGEESLIIVDPPDDDTHTYDNNVSYNGNGNGNVNVKNNEEDTKITNTTGTSSILLNRNLIRNDNVNNGEEDTNTTGTSSILLLETIMMKDEETLTQQDDDNDDNDDETFSKTLNTIASAWTSKLPPSLDTKTQDDELKDIRNGKSRKSEKSLLISVARDFLLLGKNNKNDDRIPSLIDANDDDDRDDPSILTFLSIDERILFPDDGDDDDDDDDDDNNKVGQKLHAKDVLMINITKSLDITATTICTDEVYYYHHYDDSISNYNNNVPFDEPQSSNNNIVSPAGHAHTHHASATKLVPIEEILITQ